MKMIVFKLMAIKTESIPGSTWNEASSTQYGFRIRGTLARASSIFYRTYTSEKEVRKHKGEKEVLTLHKGEKEEEGGL